MFTRAVRVGAALALLGALNFQAAAAEKVPGARQSRRGLNLQALVNAVLDVNRVFCGINNLGEVCVDPTNSPVIPGGFWPKGTPNQYIFNSGLQLGAVIPTDAGFAWAGDTIGVYLMDPRGDQNAGEGISLTYNSLDPDDLLNWPVGAMVRDAAVYSPVLLGRNTLAQQDLWVRIWDGNPTIAGARAHPMGVLVEERGLAWNFPSGNEDIVYFVYDFYNITAEDRSVYSGLDADIRDSIADIAQSYVAGVEDRFGVDIPSAGYVFEQMYGAFFMDPDVGDATANYSTAILPFQMAVAYKSDFVEPDWQYAPDIFGAPFAPHPGLVGVKYLKSPIVPGSDPPVEVGLTMFSNTVNAAGALPDPTGVIQMWRYISGNVTPAAGDNPCTFPNPKQRRLCFLWDRSADTRFFQSSGPFTLNPGERATIVVAYVHAAPVAAALEASGEVGGDFKPLIPFPGDSIAGGTCFGNAGNICVRPLDEVAGWVSHTDANLDGVITQEEVTSVPRSLLDKAIVAQAVFDNKFLLPFAPEAPDFHLIPGDNEVALVWSTSVSEITGDPFFAIASDPTSPLFDANFREFDVEGYRIYRGRTTAQLELIAQFDYSGTELTDATGAFDYGNQCAPELNIQLGCPVDFNAGETNDLDITGEFVQVRPGGRVELADGSVLIVASDTAVVGGNSGLPLLANTGVPFAFIDRGVRNSFQYFYAVTAFDVNSVKSGPSSLESGRIAQSVVPRASASNETLASLSVVLSGDDGEALDPTPTWKIDPATGRFGGTSPAVNSVAAVFAPQVSQLLPAITLTATIDSVLLRSAVEFPCGVYDNFGPGSCTEFFVTFDDGTTVTPFRTVALHPVWSAFTPSAGNPDPVVPAALGAFPVDPDSAAIERFGIPEGFTQFTASVGVELRETIRFSSWEGQYARRFGSNLSPGGSRWFEGDDETVDHPTYGVRVGGDLTGVDSVWAPIHHTDADPDTDGAQTYAASSAMQCFGYLGASGMTRQTDFEVTWSGGTITVRDLANHLDVQYHPETHSTWGFMGDADGDGVIDWQDFYFTNPTSPTYDSWGFCGHTDPGAGSRAALSQTPVILPVAAETGSPASTFGTGFGLYIAGERYMFALTGGALPPDGTVWKLRTHAGTVSAANGAETRTPSNYAFTSFERPPMVPGLTILFEVASATELGTMTDSLLALVHTVPDPYYVTTSLEATSDQRILNFVNLPPQAIIRIYSLSGVLVDVIEHNDVTWGGQATWDLRNRNEQVVATAVYFAHIETPEGLERIIRFTVVNFAQ
jgi:hypothetical protein